MTALSPSHAPRRATCPAVLAASAAFATALLAGCGGGGGGSSLSVGNAAVTSAVAGPAKYGQAVTLTVNGSGLEQGVTVTATGCGTVTATTGATATQASWQCTANAMGNGQFTVSASGATLATATFTVPAPQVTLSYGNNAGVAGDIVVTLAPDKTPATVNNFLAYVNNGFYAGTVIHRLSPGFVIQGGGYTAPFDADHQTLKTGTRAPIALEVGKGLSNTQYTIAMARTSDVNSATSQFFINLVDNSSQLDPGLTAGYAVFGSVTGATSTANVANIAASPCVAVPLVLATGECAPTPNIVITAATQTM